MKAFISPKRADDTEYTVKAPPSKSMAHRMLICAALAKGESLIKGISPSEDILATIDCLRALGAVIETKGSGEKNLTDVSVKGTDPAMAGNTLLRCRESGSTLRFMAPLAAVSEAEKELTGSATLLGRPLDVYVKAFAGHGAALSKHGDRIRVRGSLCGGEFTIPGNISSQFVSGLLFALPLLAEDSLIRLEGAVESRPYINMTIAALERFGVRAEWTSDHGLLIPGGQTCHAGEFDVEGDWSNAAFLLAMGADAAGLDENSLQGDRICKDYFSRLDREAAVIDISDCPDLGPVLMAYAALRHGCTLTGTRRLKIKESDRGSAMKEELAKFGVGVTVEENHISVAGGAAAPEEELCGHNDHRIVMSLAVMCAHTGGVIDGAEAVGKSFPDFFEAYNEAGGCATVSE